MSSLYAKTKSLIQPLSVLFLVLFTVSGCTTDGTFGNIFGNNGGYQAENTAVVSQNPDSQPDIAWQKGKAPDLADAGAKALPAAPAPHKISVAILLPLTGKRADLGQSMLKAAQLALFDMGSSNFDLVPKDTKSTPEGAGDAAREALAERADLILGPVFADDLKVVKTITAGSDIPVISFSNDWNQGGGNTYIMGFLPFAQVSRVAKYAESKGYGSFAVFAPDTEYAKVVIAALQRTGVKVPIIKNFPASQSDLLPSVKELVAQSKSVNVIMLPMGGEALNSTLSTFDEAGLKQGAIKLVGTGLWDDENIQRNPSLYGGWFAAPDPRLRVAFERKYNENFGAPPLRLATLAYDATALAAVLAKNGGDKPYSSSNLTNPRGFAGIDGVFRFRSDGLNERGLAVLEINNGRARVIDPAPNAFSTSGF